MNTEIVLFKEIENKQKNNETTQNGNLYSYFFPKNTISQELELARLVNAQNEENIINLKQAQSNLLEDNENSKSDDELNNINSPEIEMANNQTNEDNSQKNLTEPTVRATNRNSFI